MTREEFDMLKPGDVIARKSFDGQPKSFWIVLDVHEAGAYREFKIQCIWSDPISKGGWQTPICTNGTACYPSNWELILNGSDCS